MDFKPQRTVLKLHFFLPPQNFSVKKDLWSEWAGGADLVCKHFPDQVHLGDGNQSAPVLLGQEAKQSKL